MCTASVLFGERSLRSPAGVLQATARATGAHGPVVQSDRQQRAVRQEEHARDHGQDQDAGLRGRRQRVR